jgi:patatin-like phospholipase
MKIIFFLLSLAFSYEVLSSEQVQGRVWQKVDKDSFSSFPEQEGPFVPKRLNNWKKLKEQKATVGVVFSGGGSRSATLSLGQLRSLHALGFLDQINYISAVSGGSWVAVPFTYYQNDDIEVFLGDYIQPNELSDKDLKRSVDGSFAKAISKSTVFWKAIGGWITGKKDETFAHVLGNIFLRPFELNEKKFFTSEVAVLNDLLSDNSRLTSEKDFYFIKNDRPFLIVGATLQKTHWDIAVKRNPLDIFPFEITPLYVGIPTEPEGLGVDKSRLGGGYVEPLIYDSIPPQYIQVDGLRHTMTLDKKRNRFTLSDVIAASGAAPQAILTGGLRYTGIASNIGFPEFLHWPITDKDYNPRKNDYVHGDGGNIDNIGLLPLLSRQVDNIIVFINTQEDLDTGYDSTGIIPDDAMYSDLKDYFLLNPNRPKNIVFHEKELGDLYLKLSNLKEKGEPLVSCGNYEVTRNKYHNIYPYNPNICWVYNDKPRKWVNLIDKSKNLSKKEKRKIVNGKKPYKEIPHNRTFFQQWHDGQVIDRSIRHVNSASNISSWVVCETADILAKFIFKNNVEELPNNSCSQQNKITNQLIVP